MKEQMRERWRRLLERLNYSSQEIEQECFLDLVIRYSDKNRSYHNLSHISHCLDEFEQIGFLANDANAVEFAIWCHDCIYEPARNDNEELSAGVAFNMAVLCGQSESFLRSVQNLILATKHDVISPENFDEKLIVDIDLSIFGQNETMFDEYERNIRLEYAHVSEEDFCNGRARILQRFLDRPNIFSTPHFLNKYEEQARKNLVRARNIWRRS